MTTRREACLLFGGAAFTAAGTGWRRAVAAPIGPRSPGDDLPRRTPGEVGVDPDAVLAYLDEMQANRLELDSFMLARHGVVAAEGWWWPYRPDLIHMLHSATKSFTGTGVGLAVDEGLLRLEDPVLKFFPGRVANPSANLASMTVESLLTQTSGHAIGISGSSWRPMETSWIDEFFKVPVAYKPGAKFVYSSATSYMLSAIVSQVTHQPLSEYMKPRFFDPLGMRTVSWDIGPDKVNPGGNGLSSTSADFLKLGLVYLAEGKWNGRQVLSRDWTREAVMEQHGNPYGYQFWISSNPLCYSADGKFGQFCFVFPQLDAVLVTTAGVPDNAETRAKMHAIAFKHIRSICPSAPLSGGQATLIARERALRILPRLQPQGSARAREVSGKTYRCEPNADGVQALRVDFTSDRCRFTLTDERGAHVIDNGLKDWVEGSTSMTGHYLHHEYEPAKMKVVAGGRWAQPSQFDMTWQFIESGFRDGVSLSFSENSLIFNRSVNVNSGPLERPTIRAYV